LYSDMYNKNILSKLIKLNSWKNCNWW
jgi:hypothetical protein